MRAAATSSWLPHYAANIQGLQRAEIDVAFATLADDPDHRAETNILDAEFATASWEALQRAEETA